MPPIAAAGPRPLGLLLVDDHTIVREGLKRILDPAANDWSVTEPGTGFQALECLRQQRFDLAIVDLSMPGMSGLELIRRARRLHPTLRVVLMSAFGEPRDIVEAMRLGADDFLPKPFDLDAFLALCNA